MKVNEIFESIQGEGKYVGEKVLFVRVSGCTRKCSWCDTQYHKNGKEYSVKKLAKAINKFKPNIVVWTGGEPLIYEEEISKVRIILNSEIGKIAPEFHLETNGDIIPNGFYDYICFSPKTYDVAKNIYNFVNHYDGDCDIKCVCDGIYRSMHKLATMLMPLTTYDEKKDLLIKQEVWDLCIKYNKKFCLRQHVEVWKQKRGV